MKTQNNDTQDSNDTNITGPSNYVYDEKNRRLVALPSSDRASQAGGILPNIAQMYLNKIQPYVQPLGYDPVNVPPEIRGWNWGAFLMTPIWAVAHKVKGAYISFVPIFIIQLIAAVWMGSKGNEYAWQTRHWQNAEAFQSSQRKWLYAGVVWFLLVVGFVCTVLILARIGN